MPCRFANASAFPGVGDATATTSASSGIMLHRRGDAVGLEPRSDDPDLHLAHRRGSSPVSRLRSWPSPAPRAAVPVHWRVRSSVVVSAKRRSHTRNRPAGIRRTTTRSGRSRRRRSACPAVDLSRCATRPRAPLARAPPPEQALLHELRRERIDAHHPTDTTCVARSAARGLALRRNPNRAEYSGRTPFRNDPRSRGAPVRRATGAA